MRIFWYLVAFGAGTFGAIATLRALEQLVFGGGSGPIAMQAMSGMGFLYIAALSFRKARAAKLTRRPPPPVS